jgi:uncharacterized protein YecE (DUF72 family)
MIVLGTSGWQYRDWRGRFYPQGLPQRGWLEHYAEHFDTVEINNAFYRLPERKTFADWRERTPERFCFAVKMSRYLTHVKRLKDPTEPIQRFFSRAEALGPKLGPVLFQLPPTLKRDTGLLDAALDLVPPGVKVTVEPRHESWWVDGTRAVLERHDAALCWADRHSRPLTPLWTTSSWGYLRLHEGRARPWPRYGRTALASWARRIAELTPVYVYFNNDPGGAAITDARVFRSLSESLGQR